MLNLGVGGHLYILLIDLKVVSCIYKTKSIKKVVAIDKSAVVKSKITVFDEKNILS